MWLDLYDEITALYNWSLNSSVPLSLFDEIAEIYVNVRSYTDLFVRSGIRSFR